MSPEEIIAREKKYYIFVFIYMIPGMGLLFSASNDKFISQVCSLTNNLLTDEIYSMSALVISMILIFGAIYLASNQYLPKCRSCKKRLPPNQLHVVIATKNCTNCGENIVTKNT